MTPYYDEAGITLYCADVLDWRWTNETADAVVTDPPYNVGKPYDGYQDSLPREAYRSWLSKVWWKMEDLAPTLVYTPGIVNVWEVLEVLAPTNYEPVRMLGWHRKEFAGDLWNGGPAISWEPVVWASTIEKPYYTKTFGHMGRDFLVVNSTHGDKYKKLHPCPKPVQVFQWLIGLFTPEGGTVFDPFVGSGASMLAAQKMGRRFIGVEQSEKYCEIAVQRLAQGVLEFA